MNILSSKKYSYQFALSIAIWICCLAFLICFFLSIRQLVVFDADDWTYISSSRILWPDIRQWNPTKILPEIIMPLLGNIGAFLIYPLNGNYIDSLTVSFGLAAAISVIVLCLVLCVFYKKFFHFSLLKSTFLSVLFLATGFLIYKSQDNMNHFYYAQSVNTFFNYIFPGIFNAITIMLISLILFNSDTEKQPSMLKAGGLIVLVYLCINSNLFQSIILTSFISSWALIEIINGIKKSKKVFEIVKSIKYAILIDFVWLISMIFEVNGGRAAWSSNSSLDILGTIQIFFKNIFDFNKYWLLISFIMIIVGLLSFVFCMDKKKRNFYIVILLSCAFTAIYLVLLCGKVSAGYITLPQAIWGGLFFIQFLANLSLAQLLQNRHFLKLAPFIMFLALFGINNNISLYKEA